jgi:hypothetical protein
MANWKELAATIGTLLAIPFAALTLAAARPGEPLPADQRLPTFSIVVDASGPGISATCDAGCAWKTVTGEYSQPSYRITDSGIHPGPGAAQHTAFSIEVVTTRPGVAATCTTGCAWKNVAASYTSGVYRITQHGIERVGPAH